MDKRFQAVRVATLNFGGINVSPFEYHDGSKEKENLNRCFKKLLDQYNKENPDAKWNIAKIDKVLQRERYSILYKSTAGVVRGRLLAKNEYFAVWDTVFEENQQIIEHLTPTEESINLLRSFDWMMYQAFLTSLYGKIDWATLKGYNVQRYTQQLKKWHNKNYLKWQPKINCVRDYIIRENLDVLFLQEAGHQKLESDIPSGYICFRAGEAMIIVKKSFVVQDPHVSKFHLSFGSRLNFNHDSHYVKLRNCLLCCVHLSSRNNNVKQAEEIGELFREIQEKFPGMVIIAGVDANHFLRDYPYFNVYPQCESEVTTRKKRTSMQLQFQKAEKMVEEAKDHIITNLLIGDVKIETISCESVTNDLLPNQKHPYDHFVVFNILNFKRSRCAYEEHLDEGSQIDEYDSMVRNRNDSFALTTIPDELITKMRRSQEFQSSHLPIMESKGKFASNVEIVRGRTPDTNKIIGHSSKHLVLSRHPMTPTILKVQSHKPQTKHRINEVSPHQHYYNKVDASKVEEQFLQFAKSGKQGNSSTRNKSRNNLQHKSLHRLAEKKAFQGSR